jgi:hypothetical protein
MKTTNLLFVLVLVIIGSCTSGKKTNSQEVSFGIYETVQTDSIPASLIDTLKSRQIQLENNPELSILGYITTADSTILKMDWSALHVKLMTLLNPVDKDGKYYSVVVVKPVPPIGISDLKNTKVKGKDVQLIFNMKGAIKLADLSKQNMGKKIAIVIDDRIYCMPMIRGELREGLAMIPNLENETAALQISKSLNASIP